MSLTSEDKSNIEKARLVVEEYRKNHATLKKEDEAVAFAKYLKDLNALGFTAGENELPTEAINKFFEKSQQCNIEELGYKDFKDMTTTASVAEKDAYLSKWK